MNTPATLLASTSSPAPKDVYPSTAASVAICAGYLALSAVRSTVRFLSRQLQGHGERASTQPGIVS